MNNDETPRRQMRFFIYQDKEHFVIGTQNVRYEPSVEKDVYGTTEVFMNHPVRKSVKNCFPLSLYPTVKDQKGDNPADNITENVAEGIGRLFTEANKAAGLLIKSFCKIDSDHFDYNNMRILSEKDLQVSVSSFGIPDAFTLRGKISQNYEFLRKGDLIQIGDLSDNHDEKTKKHEYTWRCRWVPRENKYGIFDTLFRRPFCKLFKKDYFKKRYGDCQLINIPIGYLMLTSGIPIEKETYED